MDTAASKTRALVKLLKFVSGSICSRSAKFALPAMGAPITTVTVGCWLTPLSAAVKRCSLVLELVLGTEMYAKRPNTPSITASINPESGVDNARELVGCCSCKQCLLYC